MSALDRLRALFSSRRQSLDGHPAPARSYNGDRTILPALRSPTSLDVAHVAVLIARIDPSARSEMTETDWDRLTRGYLRLFTRAVESYRGIVRGAKGAMFGAQFESAQEAVACAIAVQQELLSLRTAAGVAPEIQMAIDAESGSSTASAELIDAASHMVDAAGPAGIVVTESAGAGLSGVTLAARAGGAGPSGSSVRLLAVVWDAG